MTTPSETAPLVPYEAFQHALGVLERLDERVARGRERCARRDALAWAALLAALALAGAEVLQESARHGGSSPFAWALAMALFVLGGGLLRDGAGGRALRVDERALRALAEVVREANAPYPGPVARAVDIIRLDRVLGALGG